MINGYFFYRRDAKDAQSAQRGNSSLRPLRKHFAVFAVKKAESRKQKSRKQKAERITPLHLSTFKL